MKVVSIITALICFLMISSVKVEAQRNWSQEADQAYDLNQYYVASDMYKTAYGKVKNKVEKARLIFRIGECYRHMNDFKQAETWYNKAVKINYEDPIVFLYLADALKINEKFDDALIQYQAYKDKVPADTRGDNGLEACKLAKKWIENPTRHIIENIKQFNSKESDFAPCYADRKFKSIYFVSVREGAAGNETDSWTGTNFSDLFFAALDKKGKWSIPVPIEEPLNSKSNDGPCWINDKGTIIYFTRCGAEKKKQLGCNIYRSEKKGPTWDIPELIPLSPDTSKAYTFGHPSLTKDETTMYFASDIPGGQGGRDIWVVKRDKKTKPFGNATNLGPTVNTAGNEMYPYIHENGDLYFSSDGHIGIGGLDIFVAPARGDAFGTPENIKFPMNSAGDDFAVIFEGASTDKGFFTSNRKGGKGNDDIYSFLIPPLVFTLKGVVTDDSTKLVLKGAIVKLVGSDGTIIYDTTDATGLYRFDKTQILRNTTYDLTISKEKYFNEKGKETTVGLTTSKDLFHDFALKPIPKAPIVLPEILYDLAKWDLKPQYQDSLNGLYQMLIDNENISIELSSHTDIRGSLAYNDTLSQNRAQSVVDYMIQKGIAADRMVARGYGEHTPRDLKRDINTKYNGKFFTFTKGTVLNEAFINSLKSNDEKEAAHQLNRRTEFKVLRTDYVPGKGSNVPNKIEIINQEQNQEKPEEKKEEGPK